MSPAQSTAPRATSYTRRIPPRNATVTKVESVSWVSDGAGGATLQRTDRWTGSEPAFVSERHDFASEAGGGISHAYVATVIVPADLLVQADEFITYTYHGRTETRQVDSVEDRADFGYARLFITER